MKTHQCEIRSMLTGLIVQVHISYSVLRVVILIWLYTFKNITIPRANILVGFYLCLFSLQVFVLALLPPAVYPSATRLHMMGEHHLIVLCHGLNGDHRELACLERAINEFPDCKVLNSKENNGGIPYRLFHPVLRHFLQFVLFFYVFLSVSFGSLCLFDFLTKKMSLLHCNISN